MSILEAFMSPHPNGIHLGLLIVGLVAAGTAIYLERREYAAQVEAFGFDPEKCSCPSGDCPGWERKAGLSSPNPSCLIHGEGLAA